MNAIAHRFGRAPGVPFRYLEDDVILAPLDSQEFEVLGGTAVAVWRLLEEPRTVEELAEILSRRYASDPASLERDLVTLLRQLERVGSVKVVDPDD